MNQLFRFAMILLIAIPARAESNKSQADSVYQGLRFEESLSWKQVLIKAKAEHKYIFVDCYTTWCGPCKQMEREVYPQAKVGEVFNDRFISFKAQMDTSKMDNEAIKSRYADAHYLLAHYKIDAYPTFLFFTPEGQLLNRSRGAKGEEEFKTLAVETANPEKNYYTILALFRQGKSGVSQTSWLARQALVLGDTAGSIEIAKSYVLHLNKDSMLTKPNVEFMQEFTKSSQDRGFSMFYQDADSVNSIMGEDSYAQQFVQSILYNEIVKPETEKAIKAGSEPDWDRLASSIRTKYNVYYSERVITAARSSWGLNRKNWPEYTKYLVQYFDKFGSQSNLGMMTSLYLNNYAWAVFLYSQEKTELTSALSWSRRAVLMDPNAGWMDTYANILYKLGQREAAIMWEETASRLEPRGTDIKNNLTKMREGKPTWPAPDKFQ